MKTDKFSVQIVNFAGSVIHEDFFHTELAAQNHFDYLETIRYPKKYSDHIINASEHYDSRVVGYVRLIVENKHGFLIRRELFRKA